VGGARRGELARQVLGDQGLPFLEQDHALDQVAELPHVAGPRIAEQPLGGLG
jgi:hypothetical protein